ncbi:hypothetical protein [Paenirhodobacter populi]|uniref:hypothetical protein n=1 Tax=Paenirhodobacter populi TaxID=2306993 RepID=UPI003613DCB0
MIERLWEKVGAEDDLWFIGDFAFGPKAKEESWLRTIFGQLPGARRHLVVGNHDGAPTQALPWDSVSWLVEVNDPISDIATWGADPSKLSCHSLAKKVKKTPDH